MSANPKITDWAGRKVWLVGASSGIGEALAIRLRERGAILAVSARRREPLEELIADAAAGSMALTLDVTDAVSVSDAVSQIRRSWGEPDLVIWLAGTYVPMQAHSFDLEKARSVVTTNLIGPLNGLAALLPGMLTSGGGGIVFVSSVAGYRGLPKSLIYGPSKAALTNLAESLYLDLHPRGVGVWVISPGFVETPLTEQNDFQMPGLLSAGEAADAIVAGLASGRFEVHFPKRFTSVMKMMRSLPYRLYFALIGRLVKT